MPLPRRLHRLLVAVLLVTGLVLSANVKTEAKVKKSRRASAGAKKKTRGYVKRGKRYRPQSVQEDLSFDSSQNYPIVPDNIEVIEHGSSNYGEVGRWYSSSMSRASYNSGAVMTELASSSRRISVRMDSARVLEIQEALLRRGFFNGEISGVYDEPTKEAMRRFQASQKIPVTGYPTAHALKRLGLAS